MRKETRSASLVPIRDDNLKLAGELKGEEKSRDIRVAQKADKEKDREGCNCVTCLPACRAEWQMEGEKQRESCT